MTNNGIVDGIQSPSLNKTDNGAIYNLKGQLIKVEQDKDIDDVKNSLPAGVYIQSGKKVIVK